MNPSVIRQHLAKASYEDVEFPVLVSTRSQGHDRALFGSFGVNGQDIQTTGRRARTGKLKVALSGSVQGYGEIFPGLYAKLDALFDSRPIGALRHPTMGLLEAHIDQWDEEFTPASSDGPASFEFTWTERGDVSSPLFEVDLNAPASTSAVGEQLNQSAQDADKAVQTAIPQATKQPAPTAPVIARQTEFLESAPRSFLDAEGAIAEMRTVVSAALGSSFLAATGADGFEARVLLSDAQVGVERYSAAYLAKRKVRTYVVTVDSTLADLAASPAVLGDARRASELLAANRIGSIWMVRAGTVLTIVDA